MGAGNKNIFGHKAEAKLNMVGRYFCMKNLLIRETETKSPRIIIKKLPECPSRHVDLVHQS